MDKSRQIKESLVFILVFFRDIMYVISRGRIALRELQKIKDPSLTIFILRQSISSFPLLSAFLFVALFATSILSLLLILKIADVLMILLLIGVIFALIWYTYNERKVIKTTSKFIEATSQIDIFDVFEMFKFLDDKAFVLRKLLKDQKMVRSEENLLHLRNLIAYVSNIRTTRDAEQAFLSLQKLDPALVEKMNEGWQRREYLHWLGLKGFYFYQGRWSADALDELCKLYELLRSTASK